MGAGLLPNRPKTFARYLTIPQKVTTVSICAKGPGRPEGYPGPRLVTCLMASDSELRWYWPVCIQTTDLCLMVRNCASEECCSTLLELRCVCNKQEEYSWLPKPASE
jgi:hypothetical protein